MVECKCKKKKVIKMKKIIILIFILFIYIVSGCSIPDFIEKPTEDNPTEHTCVYDKQVIEEEYLSIPATCTSKAKYYYSCSCGKKGYNTFLYGEVALHTWGEKVLKEESKYNEEDGKYYNIYSSSCEVCLAEKKEKVEVTKEDFK